MEDARNAIGKLCAQKFTGTQIKKMLREYQEKGIRKIETAPVTPGAKKGSYVSPTPDIYDKWDSLRYICPTCQRVYEARDDIEPSKFKCQYDGTTLKPYNPKAASDGDDREVARQAQPEKVKKSDISVPPSIKCPEEYIEGIESSIQNHAAALDYISNKYGTSGDGRGSSFMKGWISTKKGH